MNTFNLRYVIDNNITLTDEQIAAIIAVVGYRCSKRTKFILNQNLRSIESISNWSIYEGLQIEPFVQLYAAQSHDTDLKCIRDLLLKG